MDYTVINQLISFFELETINAKNSHKLPQKFKPILDRMTTTNVDKIEGIVDSIDSRIQFISIKNAEPFPYQSKVQKVFLNDKFDEGIFIFTKDLVDLGPVDEIIEKDLNSNGKDLILRNYLMYAGHLVLNALRQLDFPIDDIERKRSLFERQLANVPAYILTRLNPRINKYFQGLSAEDIHNRYSTIFNVIFYRTPMITEKDYQQYSLLLSNIASSDNPFMVW